MKHNRTKSLMSLAGVGLVANLTLPAGAVEGGLGRPISGAAIMPYAGVVPPAPGFAVGLGETYYEGSIGGGRTVPTGQLLAANLDLKVSVVR